MGCWSLRPYLFRVFPSMPCATIYRLVLSVTICEPYTHYSTRRPRTFVHVKVNRSHRETQGHALYQNQRVSAAHLVSWTALSSDLC